MSYTTPTTDEFKVQFARDFAYNLRAGQTTGDDTSLDRVRNADITQAQLMAGMTINPALCESQEIYTLGHNLLAAHFLALAIQAASQGLGSSGAWLTQSKSVESLREAFVIPRKIRDNPSLALLSKTQYGLQFLQLFSVRLVGNVSALPGMTLP